MAKSLTELVEEYAHKGYSITWKANPALPYLFVVDLSKQNDSDKEIYRVGRLITFDSIKNSNVTFEDILAQNLKEMEQQFTRLQNQ